MEILGLPNQNINIMTAEEIFKKGSSYLSFLKTKHQAGHFILDEARNELRQIKEQPMPYKLFRLNDMMDFTLNYIGCEITEEQYFDRLEQLPPISFTRDIYSGYVVPECITENRYEHLFKHNNKFYCVIMDKVV